MTAPLVQGVGIVTDRRPKETYSTEIIAAAALIAAEGTQLNETKVSRHIAHRYSMDDHD